MRIRHRVRTVIRHIAGLSVFAQSGVDGSASGDTLTATVSLLSGAAVGSATASGATLTVVASTVDGVAAGAASASGATLADAASTIDGVASGGANTSGVTLTANVSLIDGIASGGAADATASGATLTVAASLIDGVATGDLIATAPTFSGGRIRKRRYRDLEEEQDAVASSAILSSRVVLIAGTAIASAVAHGGIVTIETRISRGKARGGAVVNGCKLQAGALFYPGEAAGGSDASADGGQFESKVHIISGTAKGFDAFAYDNDFLIAA